VIPRLWYVSDGARGTGGRPIADVVRAAVEGGVEAVLLRLLEESGRQACALLDDLAPLRARGLRIVVSRRLDLVRSHGLDGVHLARDAVSVADARAWLGPDFWIGYSAHAADEAGDALRAGADYVTLSPIYATDSKPGSPGRGLAWLERACERLDGPVLALGGVTAERTRGILETGAWGIAAVSAIGARSDVAGAARAFSRTLAESTACRAESSP